MGLWLRTAIVLVWAAATWAWADCDPATARNMLEIEGIGTASFDEFTTDRATGSVSLRGAVCIDDLGGAWTMRAQQVDITGLREDRVEPRLLAEGGRISFNAWHFEGTTMTATQEAVTITFALVSGPNVVGTASSVRLEIDDGTAHLRDLDLQGTVFIAKAAAGVLDGRILTLTDAVATTCACSGDPAYVVAAPVAEVDVLAGSFVLVGGELRTSGVTLPLSGRVAIAGDPADALRLPLVVERQAVADGDLGEGWTVLWSDVVPASDLQVSAGVTGLTTHLQPISRLRASAPGAEIAFALPADGFVLDARTVRDLGGGLRVTMDVQNQAVPRADHLHQGVLALEHRLHVEMGPPLGTIDVDSRAFAAISAQTLDGTPVAGPRLGVGTEVGWTSGATAAGSFALTVGLEGTGYPDQAAHQVVGSVTPSWSFSVGALAGSVRYRGVAVDGLSPFGATLDRAKPESALDADGRMSWSAAGVDAAAAFGASYDFLADVTVGPGWSELGAVASLALPAGPGTWSIALRTDVAGLLGNRAAASAFAEARTGFAWSGHELGTRARYDLEEAALAALEVSSRVRLEGDDVVVTPYLAVDLAPWWRMGAPTVTGHGLEVAWTSCCGTLTVGYEQGSEGLTTRLAFRVDERPITPPEPAR